MDTTEQRFEEHPQVLRMLLNARLDPAAYRTAWASGTTPDELPYGLEHEPEGWRFEIASRRAVAKPLVLLGKVIRRGLGFDLLHAWINRDFLDSDHAVYCHSEEEYLAAAMIMLLRRNRTCALIGQTIWLFHSYNDLPAWRRRLTMRLLRRVNVFVYNAAPNASIGRMMLPRAQHRYVPFGISAAFGMPSPGDAAPSCSPGEQRWDVVSVGNDVGRDWDVLEQSMQGLGLRTRIATRQCVMADTGAVVGPTSTLRELTGLYGSTACVVVAVKTNSHASGITSLLEAAASSCAVIASRTGGLDAYFSDDEVVWVPPESPGALRDAMVALLADETELRARGQRLHAAFLRMDYHNATYWQRITELVHEVRHPKTGHVPHARAA